MSALRTPICDLLGCDYPIIQTAMGWVATAELVVASCNAGAFGFLAAAVMSPQEVDAAIRKIKAQTDKPFGVNFHMFQPGAKEIVDLIIQHKVRACSYGRGPDAATIKKLRDGGVVCIPTVGALKHAQKAIQLGANAVVVQGGEGGGHTGSVASSILLPQVLDAVQVPVVAAGGFRDGRGLAAALAYGADGIAMGTRFLLTKESPVPEPTKARYIAAEPTDMVVSEKLDGLPQRMLLNEILKELENTGPIGLAWLAMRNGLAYRKMTGESILGLLVSAWQMRKAQGLSLGQTMMSANAPMMIQEAMVLGHPDKGILPGGQVAGAIGDLPSVADLIASIVAQAEERLGALRK
jgi:NAD(P)H-dependent flavin oxidoreductase YrpB (nitropropane dioxygenase family)